MSKFFGFAFAALLLSTITRAEEAAGVPEYKADAAPVVGVGPQDWGQWGGNSIRNNTPEAENLPVEWDIGKIDRDGTWAGEGAKNIKWTARLGSQSYGNPVIANGQVYVGSNNGAGYLKRYPAATDLGVLLAFSEQDGKFLWQHSSEKLSTGRVHDWPLQGVCCAPLIEGERGWFVTSRGEVVCFDTQGFHDGENDGPFKDEKVTDPDEADTIWSLDMMGELGISQHNMCSCSVTSSGDILFVCTSNGVDESHINIPAPDAPSFIAIDKNTGQLLWADGTPGVNIMHGQWSSPTYAVIEGVPQVMFGGGDGWLYSFSGEATPDKKPKLLWAFDCNPKESKWVLGGRATRNDIIATPVVYKGLVYVAVGQDPEHGEGIGHLWCIDPTKRGDISPELAFSLKDPNTPLPVRRIQAVVKEDGEVSRPNPNSGLVWHYSEYDANGNGKFEFEETMHRAISTCAIKDDILYTADFSGLFHCLDARTGKPHYTHDMLAACWGSPLVADGKVYIGDEDGDVLVFKHGTEPEVLAENNMTNSVYSTPVVANGVLYIANRDRLFAITADGK